MSATRQTAVPPVCPRCQSNTTTVRGVSPVAGVWTIYGCDTCFYTWRSTESEANTDPAKYPAVFRLAPGDLPKLQVAPRIPPLRQSSRHE
jgi:vanillate/4-hydroxybenzoate decarboxylase subunit D